MTEDTVRKLKTWAKKYNNVDFISNDPVQVPHTHTHDSLQDLEISAFLTAHLSFGNRKQIIKTAYRLDDIMQHSPYRYVMSGKWRSDFPDDDSASFYRMLTFANMNGVFSQLHGIYAKYDSMEDAILAQPGEKPFNKLCKLFGISDKSPQKKMNMFLRWMVRNDGIVDFGAWKKMSPCDLLIPLDTHVSQMAFKLGLTEKETYSLKAAENITQALAEVFPDDPCLGDFALFGYGVEND